MQFFNLIAFDISHNPSPLGIVGRDFPSCAA